MVGALRLAGVITSGVTGVLGSALSAVIAIFGATGQSRPYYIAAAVLIFVLALVAGITFAISDHVFLEEQPAKIREGMMATLEAFHGTFVAQAALAAPSPEPNPTSERRESALWTKAERAVENLPKQTSLRLQIFDIVNAGKANLREYHGDDLTVDEWVSPEFIRAWTPLHFPVKDKTEAFLKRRILREESKLPMTVDRMAGFLDDIERAAGDLPADIPPADADYRERR